MEAGVRKGLNVGGIAGPDGEYLGRHLDIVLLDAPRRKGRLPLADQYVRGFEERRRKGKE